MIPAGAGAGGIPLRRLAALVPAPYTYMVRSHGIFANRSEARRQLPAPPFVDDEAPPRPRHRVPWAALLRRVFAVDMDEGFFDAWAWGPALRGR